MSESRDTGTGLGGRERKRTKHLDVSKEGNASPSTPSQTATDAKPSGKGNVDETHDDVVPESKLGNKPEDPPMTKGHHHHDNVVPESKLGDSSELQDTATSSAKVSEFERGKALFELQLTPLDVEQRRLLIPAEKAANYFPPLGTPDDKAYKQMIEISNTQNEDWYMTLVYNPQEHAFFITNGWQEFVDWHNLETMGVIRFYGPVPHSHDNHFLIEYVKREEAETKNIPEFKQEKFLFQLQLAPGDVTFSRLIVPKEEVRNHFPVIKIPAAALKKERLKFTDAQSKDWCMKIIFYRHIDAYMITNGWEEFVKEHNLQAMDVVKFYEPVQPSHARHFLINYVKREEAGTNQPQLGSATNNGNREGQSHGGCYNGKEVAGGHEKPAPGGPEQSCHAPPGGKWQQW